jgi:hypothetical protein
MKRTTLSKALPFVAPPVPWAARGHVESKGLCGLEVRAPSDFSDSSQALQSNCDQHRILQRELILQRAQCIFLLDFARNEQIVRDLFGIFLR